MRKPEFSDVKKSQLFIKRKLTFLQLKAYIYYIKKWTACDVEKQKFLKTSSLFSNRCIWALFLYQNNISGCGLAWDREEKNTLRGKPEKGWNQHILFKSVFFHLLFNVIILCLLLLFSIIIISIIIIIIIKVRVLSLDGTTRNKLMFNLMQMSRVFSQFIEHTPNKRFLSFFWKVVRRTLSKVKYLLWFFFSDCLELFFFLGLFSFCVFYIFVPLFSISSFLLPVPEKELAICVCCSERTPCF